jgi:hypothetical protein
MGELIDDRRLIVTAWQRLPEEVVQEPPVCMILSPRSEGPALRLCRTFGARSELFSRPNGRAYALPPFGLAKRASPNQGGSKLSHSKNPGFNSRLILIAR